MDSFLALWHNTIVNIEAVVLAAFLIILFTYTMDWTLVRHYINDLTYNSNTYPENIPSSDFKFNMI